MEKNGGWTIFGEGIVGCTPTNVPLWNPDISPISRGYLWVSRVSYPQESLERDQGQEYNLQTPSRWLVTVAGWGLDTTYIDV